MNLEDERDEYKQAAGVEAQLRRELKAERDAIEAKTIERCAQAVDKIHWIEEVDGSAVDALMHAVGVIRALKLSEATSLQDADLELQDAVIALAKRAEETT